MIDFIPIFSPFFKKTIAKQRIGKGIHTILNNVKAMFISPCVS